jgi:hypothetical protein
MYKIEIRRCRKRVRYDGSTDRESFSRGALSWQEMLMHILYDVTRYSLGNGMLQSGKMRLTRIHWRLEMTIGRTTIGLESASKASQLLTWC